jgi:hypothetical protein
VTHACLQYKRLNLCCLPDSTIPPGTSIQYPPQGFIVRPTPKVDVKLFLFACAMQTRSVREKTNRGKTNEREKTTASPHRTHKWAIASPTPQPNQPAPNITINPRATIVILVSSSQHTYPPPSPSDSYYNTQIRIPCQAKTPKGSDGFSPMPPEHLKSPRLLASGNFYSYHIPAGYARKKRIFYRNSALIPPDGGPTRGLGKGKPGAILQ